MNLNSQPLLDDDDLLEMLGFVEQDPEVKNVPRKLDIEFSSNILTEKSGLTSPSRQNLTRMKSSDGQVINQSSADRYGGKPEQSNQLIHEKQT